MSSKPSDESLRNAINKIFDAYDTDKSGTLERTEVQKLLNDVFKSLGKNKTAS